MYGEINKDPAKLKKKNTPSNLQKNHQCIANWSNNKMNF